MFVTTLDQALSDSPSHDRFDTMSIIFHWATLVFIIAMFATIWAHDQASDGDTAMLWLELHRSIGVLIWVLTLFRLLWKAGFGYAPPPPISTGTGLHLIAKTHHGLLYALLIVQPLTGFLQSIWRGKAFPLFGTDFPVIALRNKDLAHLLHDLHEAGATALLIMIGLHALAALFHGLALRDGVLGRMLPFMFLRKNADEPVGERLLPPARRKPRNARREATRS